MVFTDTLKIPIRITTDISEFSAFIGPKISYTKKPIADEIFFYATHFLFEKGIKEQEITIFDFEDTIGFFETSITSSLPFDPFAASFYLVSRYEECLPHIRDEYDRFNSHESLAFKNNFLKKPVVNIWAQKIELLIKNKYPDYKIPEKNYEFTPTIDVDNAYAFTQKGVIRTIGSFLLSLKNGRFNDLWDRIRANLGLLKDPYDTYHLYKIIHKKYNLKPIYFFLVGDYDINDNNISINRRKYRELIKSMSDYVSIGLHPSFNSTMNINKLKKESNRLSNLLKREITKSRQHFLKLTLPYTYRNLLELDITDDYTMGYATEIGFRAGICSAFNYYDIDLETETSLKIHPFCVMDATLLYYSKLKPSEVEKNVLPIIEEVKKVNGHFMLLWHNESLSNYGVWEGWEDVYEKIIQLAIKSEQ